MKFDVTTVSFNAQFKVSTQISQPSVLFYSSEYWYPNGLNVRLTDASGNGLALDTDFTLDLSEQNYAKIQVINPAFDG